LYVKQLGIGTEASYAAGGTPDGADLVFTATQHYILLNRASTDEDNSRIDVNFKFVERPGVSGEYNIDIDLGWEKASFKTDDGGYEGETAGINLNTITDQILGGSEFENVGAYIFVDGLPGGGTDGTWKIQLFSDTEYIFGSSGTEFSNNFQSLKNVPWTGVTGTDFNRTGFNAPDPKSHDFNSAIPTDSAGQMATVGPKDIAPLLQGGSISYNIKNSGSIQITNGNNNTTITADLYLVLPLKLKLSSGGQSMTIDGASYRHIDMNGLDNNTNDLFGREEDGGEISDLLKEIKDVSLRLDVVRNDLIDGIYLGLGFPFTSSGSVNTLTDDKKVFIDLSIPTGSDPKIVTYTPEDITPPFNPGFGLYVPSTESYITIKPVTGESSEQLKLNMIVGASADIVKEIDF
jgi:hypothetical protein